MTANAEHSAGKVECSHDQGLAAVCTQVLTPGQYRQFEVMWECSRNKNKALFWSQYICHHLFLILFKLKYVQNGAFYLTVS